MPGTDGPRQFPCSQTPLSGAGWRGRAPPTSHGLFTQDPNLSVKSLVCSSRGQLFFLLPHTPTHTASESPNVPQVDTFPLLAGKNMQMLAFTL